MIVDYLLTIFLLLICVSLSVLCGNTNQRLRQCLTANGDEDNNGGSNDNGGGGSGGNDTEDDPKKTCEKIQHRIETKRSKKLNQTGIVFSTNPTNIKSLQWSNVGIQLATNTSRTGEYDVPAYEALVKLYPNNTTFIPKFIGFSMVLANFKRNEKIEQLLLSYMNKPNNKPLDQTDMLQKFNNLSYFVIFMNYQKYNNLQLYQPTKELTDGIDQLFSSIMSYQVYPSDPKTDLAPGFYPDGFITDKQATGTVNTIDFVSNVVYIILSYRLVKDTKDRPLLNELLRWIYDRLFFTIRGDYTQLRGGRFQVTNPSYRYRILHSLNVMYTFDPTRFPLPINVIAQMYNSSNYNYQCELFPEKKVSTTIADGNKKFQDLRLASRCEGFVFYANDWFTFEQSCTSPYLTYPKGSAIADQMEFNTYYLTGYINYGCDYISFMNTVNMNNDYQEVLLPGQTIIKVDNTRSVPNTAILVKLDDSLYYQSTYIQNLLHVNGIIDGKTKTHRIYIETNNSSYRYCLFGWVSCNQALIVKTNDNRYILYDVNLRVVMSAKKSDGTSVQIVYQTFNLVNGKHYNYFCVDTDMTGKMVVTLCFVRDNHLDDPVNMEKTNTERIENYEIVNGLTANVTINPNTNNSLVTTVRNKTTKALTIVDESNKLSSDNPIDAIFNGKTYQFSDLSRGRSATIPVA